MNIKSIMDKLISTIEKAGLKLTSSDQTSYGFRHEDGSVGMAIEMVHMPILNGCKPFVIIRVHYSVFYGTFHEIIRPEHLLFLGEDRVSKVVCVNQEEVEQAINHFVQQAVTAVIPYLYRVEYTAVAPKENLYHCLSEKVDVRCKTFIKAYGLPAGTPLEKIKSVEGILKRLQPEDPWDRKEVFFDSQEMILNMAAYLGQVILQHVAGHWTESLKNGYEYFLVDSLGRTYDPLWAVVQAWNFWPEVTAASLTSQLQHIFKDKGSVHLS